jgi:hypothetical protein
VVALYRLQSELLGLAGGTGLSTFHFLASGGDGEAAQDSVDAFWAVLQPYMNNSITVQPTNELVTFEDTTGDILSFTTTTGQSYTGSDPTVMLSPATQGLVRWGTEGVVNNRRVQGHTYIPGATEAVNDAGGRPNTEYRVKLGDAAAALIANINSIPAVWSRPREADPEADPPVAARVGSSHQITGGSGWSQWAVLRGRRDS